jgi:hypothetical protein
LGEDFFRFLKRLLQEFSQIKKMSRNKLQFPPHFLVTLRGNEKKDELQVYNRETLKVDGEIPYPIENFGVAVPEFFQSSTGRILIMYPTYPWTVYTFDPSSKVLKKSESIEYFKCVGEFPSGKMAVFMPVEGTGRSDLSVYDESWQPLETHEVIDVNHCLVLSPTNLVADSGWSHPKLTVYSYPGLDALRSKDTTSRIFRMAKITNSHFVTSDYDAKITLWNRSLHSLKSYKIGVTERMLELHALDVSSAHKNPEVTVLAVTENRRERTVGISVFKLGELKSSEEVVEVKINKLIRNAREGSYSVTFLRETREVLVATFDGIFAVNVDTFDTQKLIGFQENFLRIKEIWWPPTKAEVASAVEKMKSFGVPVPNDILGVIARFL